MLTDGHCVCMAGFVRTRVSAGGPADPRARPGISALRMGGGNVPRVPYKAPGEQGYQVCSFSLGPRTGFSAFSTFHIVSPPDKLAVSHVEQHL